jgi:hypothetical protein
LAEAPCMYDILTVGRKIHTNELTDLPANPIYMSPNEIYINDIAASNPLFSIDIDQIDALELTTSKPIIIPMYDINIK